MTTQGEMQRRMDRLVSELGPSEALEAMATSLRSLATYREHVGATAPVVALRSVAEDLLALKERV